MELRALRAFVEVARSGSFTQAAETLSVTQPTVSKLVGLLESELGLPLLQRNSRRALPTDAGRLVFGYAEAMLAGAANIELALAELGGLRRGELRIGLPPLGPRLFVPLIGAFKRRYPGIELKPYEDGSRAIEQALVDGQLELGGLLDPVDGSRFEHRMLIDDRLALLAPARSRWARRREVRLAELAEEPFIMFPAAYALNERITEACRQCGFTPDVVGRSGQIGFILELVRCGVGVSLLPSTELGQLDLKDFAVSALIEPVIPWRLDMAWLRGGYLSAAARAWLELSASN
ncbi:MAG TPA: LysR family transcriptional regulator [Parasulfuritortus sp.]